MTRTGHLLGLVGASVAAGHWRGLAAQRHCQALPGQGRLAPLRARAESGAGQAMRTGAKFSSTRRPG